MIFDTSVLIKTIRSGKEFEEEGSISVITLIEVLRGIDDKQKRDSTMSLIEETFTIIDVDKTVAASYIELHLSMKKKGEVISDADALIAATALARGETLLTSDKGFLKFKPLISVELLSP